MRLEDKFFGFVVNFLLGVAWAIILIGAITSFLSFYHESLFLAILVGCLATVPGMLGVLFLEHIMTVKEQHSELKKQTKLLEDLLKY